MFYVAYVYSSTKYLKIVVLDLHAEISHENSNLDNRQIRPKTLITEKNTRDFMK